MASQYADGQRAQMSPKGKPLDTRIWGTQQREEEDSRGPFVWASGVVNGLGRVVDTL